MKIASKYEARVREIVADAGDKVEWFHTDYVVKILAAFGCEVEAQTRQECSDIALNGVRYGTSTIDKRPESIASAILASGEIKK